MKRKPFEHYAGLYLSGNREWRFSSDEEGIKAAIKGNRDALERMVAFYPEETKSALLSLMDNQDPWLALGAAKDFAYSFDLTFEVKTKIRQTIKRCEKCKTCTGVDRVSLAILANYVNSKK